MKDTFFCPIHVRNREIPLYCQIYIPIAGLPQRCILVHFEVEDLAGREGGHESATRILDVACYLSIKRLWVVEEIHGDLSTTAVVYTMRKKNVHMTTPSLCRYALQREQETFPKSLCRHAKHHK